MSEQPFGARWFADRDQFVRFCNLVERAYGAALHVTESSGLATGDVRHAVLLTRLVRKMIAYNEEQSAAALDPELLADLDREAGLLWPVFKERLDASLDEAMELVDILKETEGKPN